MVLIVCVFIFTFDFSLAEIKHCFDASCFPGGTYGERGCFHSIFDPRQTLAKSPQNLPKSDIAEQGYDLSINRYKEVVYEEVEHRPPQEILDELEGIEHEIMQGMEELRGMLS